MIFFFEDFFFLLSPAEGAFPSFFFFREDFFTRRGAEPCHAP